ncbi:MAG TPA: coniferyl aldehyde dehydrogenase [Burkholderiales bacterium]|nr:coniferyl aldehyde dehydrogenase [Burkholderiales bacterium]
MAGVKDLRALLELQRRAFAADPLPPATAREERLARLLAMVEKHADAFAAAISEDFGHRSRHETQIAEVFVAIAAIRHARRHLGRWMRVRRAPTAMYYRPGYNRVLPQPVGVAGIVSPWNYPLQLALGPAVGALAAGNRVMLKPSELTPRCTALLERTIAGSFAEEEMAVVTGGADVGRAFVELPFDHLLFTGSTAVGRTVALAAAKNLTPVTLELGGKSPAILDASCDMAAVAPRLAVGKLLNAGQTCIAPDYALVPEARVEEFVAAMRAAVARLYPRFVDNDDYTSVVSDRHYVRLEGLLADATAKGARVVTLGEPAELPDAARRRLPPVLVLGASDDMALMKEEIFGPLLPVIGYRGIDEAIAQVNRRDRPLALYWFGEDEASRERVLARTVAGGVTVNDCLLHFAQEDVPFGGAGASGIGAYHGEAGFRTFSKEKPVFFQSKLNGMFLMRPPYGRAFEKVVALLKRIA